MRTTLKVAALLFLGSGIVYGQQPTFHDQLLDHLTGNWVLQGTIMGKENTHDISAEWVLGHQYLRIHEVSREKDAHGQPDYEAMPFVGWDQAAGEYVCAWLDTYGGMNATSIGHAKRDGNEIHFLFKDKDSIFHTRFIYHPEDKSWEWRMDSEEKGVLKPFLRAKLTRP
jgi:hypothetical protein